MKDNPYLQPTFKNTWRHPAGSRVRIEMLEPEYMRDPDTRKGGRHNRKHQEAVEQRKAEAVAHAAAAATQDLKPEITPSIKATTAIVESTTQDELSANKVDFMQAYEDKVTREIALRKIPMQPVDEPPAQPPISQQPDKLQ
ncbi:MAG: hypothetical protein JWP85_2809 [Rhodoglobus sp.]|nr:hypothetical protein [Rhodoglobus sp.]